MDSWPFSAPGCPPDIGASKKYIPFELSDSFISIGKSEEVVV